MKRSNQPPLWLLFGAGGMLSALIGWALVLATGIAGPLGYVDWMTAGNVAAFARHPGGKAFILAVIALFLWHGAHRIFHTLHDLGIRSGTGAFAACYGFAFAGTVAAAVLLALVR